MAVIEQLFSVSSNAIYSLSGKEMLSIFAIHIVIYLVKVPGCDLKSMSRVVLIHTPHSHFF